MFRYIYKLDKVCKTYASSGNDVVALNDVSINIPEKRVVGIVGTSGMGKSTLLNILGGIDSPDEGTVLFGGGYWGGIYKSVGGGPWRCRATVATSCCRATRGCGSCRASSGCSLCRPLSEVGWRRFCRRRWRGH